MRRHILMACVLVGAVALASCGGGGGDDDGVNPSDPNSVMNNLLLKVGGASATLMTGSPPAATSSTAAPKAIAGTGTVTTTTGSGSTANIPVSFQAGAAMASIFAKIGNSTTFFEADNPPSGGKVAKVVPTSGNGQTFILTFQLGADFAPGEFCFLVSGKDALGRVSAPVSVCANLVANLPQLPNDQPDPSGLSTALGGVWVSTCQPFQTGDTPGSARIGFSFEGTSYSQFLEQWGSTGCNGNPVNVGNIVSGSFQTGTAAIFLPNSVSWAVPIDFIPSTPSGSSTCFNVLRFVSGTPNRFGLGLPKGFTRTTDSDTVGSCKSVNTRPQFFSSDIVFSPGDVLPEDQLPVANAGPDQAVAPSVTVHLTGAGSSDADTNDSIVSYSWVQTGGTPTVTLSNANSVSPTFTAPATPATLTFTLTVTDESGGTDTDTVTINVAVNATPIANAGPDFNKPSGSSVQLNGNASSDPDGSIASYAWVQTAGPNVVLNNAGTATPTFTAPTIQVGSAVLTFQLTVTDNRGATATDSVTVTILVTTPPTANAGPDQSVKTGTLVTLDGTASSDPDQGGSIASYAWTQVGGSPSVTLAGANTAHPTFTAPVVATGSIVLSFQLVVTDNAGATSTPDTVAITVNAKQAPIANAGPDFGALSGQQDVQLSGTGSSDPDGSVVSYSWAETSGPAVTLVNANTATPKFDAPNAAVGTTLGFRLTVTDNDGLTSTDNVVVTITAPLVFSYSSSGMTDGATAFTFTLLSNNQPIGNWFVDQSNASLNPEPAVFNRIVGGVDRCTGGPQGSAQIVCNGVWVAHYLGTSVTSGGCVVDQTANTGSKATLSPDTKLLTFSVKCSTFSLQGGEKIGIGYGQNPGATAPNGPARSASTGDTEPVTGTCTVGGPTSC